MTTRFSSLLLALLLLPAASHAQSLLLDNFNYTPGTALTANGWTQVGTVVANPIVVTTPGLEFPNYPGASGNAAALTTSGQDVSRNLTVPVTAGSAYMAVLVNLSAAKTGGDYFLNVGAAGGANPFGGRVFAKAVTGGFQLGISKSTNVVAYGTPVYAFGTTYLVVMKYTVNGETTTDDLSDLYVFAAGENYSVEPAAPLATSTDGTDIASVGAVNLRQGSSSTSPTVIVDGIRIGTSWNEAVLATQTVEDGAGYRLLGAPVGNVTVGTLAGINLVQSVTGQYPTFPADNLFLTYDGTGTSGYVAATDIIQNVVPGVGFLWYLFDQDITPSTTADGGGTSRSYTLPERQLFASGPVLTTNLTVGFPLHTDGFYLLANPFAQSMLASGITLSGTGTFANNLQLFDGQGFTPRDRTTAGVELSMWQGAFAEVQGGTDNPLFSYAAASRTDGLTPLVSRAAATTGLALTLTGTTSAGATRDAAAIVRFDAAASAGWDAGDASKLTPPTPVHALVAPVGDLYGTARRQAVLSLPALADVTLAFTTTHAGTFTLTADATGLPADATVRDLVTGTSARLADGLTFTADATDWTERFVVSFGRTTAGEPAAAGFSLGQVFPNPAAAGARVALRVDAAQTVSATVVDALGRTVATVFEGALSAGQSQDLAVDTATLAPGVYVVRIAGETFSATRRLVVAR